MCGFQQTDCEIVYDRIEDCSLYSQFLRQYSGKADRNGSLLTKIWQVNCIIDCEGGFEFIEKHDQWNRLAEKYGEITNTLGMSFFEFVIEYNLPFILAKYYKQEILGSFSYSQLFSHLIEDRKTASICFMERDTKKVVAVVFKNALDQDSGLTIQNDEDNIFVSSLTAKREVEVNQKVKQETFNLTEWVKRTEIADSINIETFQIETQLFDERILKAEEYLKYSEKIPYDFRFASCSDTLHKIPEETLRRFLPKLLTISSPTRVYGQEEPMRFSSVYINIGPAPVEWSVISETEIAKIREIFLEDKKVDIFKRNVKLFEDFYYCIAKQRSIKRFIQEVNQGVVISSGTYFWQNFLGPTKMVQWNFCREEMDEIKQVWEKTRLDSILLQESQLNFKIFARSILSQPSKHCTIDTKKFTY
jgi:hypothetical protein